MLLDEFGIDVLNPAELVHYSRDESGLHLVGGWYHFIGRICSGEDCNVSDLDSLAGGAQVGFTRCAQFVRRGFEGFDIVQLEFLVKIPWRLFEPEPDF